MYLYIPLNIMNARFGLSAFFRETKRSETKSDEPVAITILKNASLSSPDFTNSLSALGRPEIPANPRPTCLHS